MDLALGSAGFFLWWEELTLLNQKQKRAAEMLANPDCTMTKSEIAEAIGVHPETFYRWLLDREFVTEAEALSRRYAEAEIAMIRKSVISGCRSGDAKSIKLFFDLQNALIGSADSLSADDRALLAESVRLLSENGTEKNG